MRLEDVSVGFVDIEKWRLPAGTQVDDPKYFEQTAREYQQAKDTLRQSGVKVVDAYIIPPEEYMIGDTNVDDLMDKIIRCQGKNGIERYLKALKFSKVRTLEQILKFNEDHAEVELDKGMALDRSLRAFLTCGIRLLSEPRRALGARHGIEAG
ncbi:hypothetical protein NW757_004522 [Fusarium falciforme]|nr:hypothetical protein NW757_004522 [Fusarium falciforme]